MIGAMKHLLPILLMFPGIVCAQYAGGNGDGHSFRLIIQTDLTGIPGGIRPLYAGGQGDGCDQQTASLTLGGEGVEQLFSGGHGDGFSRLALAISLNGQALEALFAGGNGDGSDQLFFTATLSGLTLTGLFSGGSGDGFDRGAVAGALGGQPISGLYSGGNGDGFDRMAFAGSLNGAMFNLYAGGSGDGFDEATGSFTLGGQSLAVLYAGGQGDGFDTETLMGVLPLPLTLISFDAFPEDKYVLLQWITEDEVATNYFTIEKTRNGSGFATVGTTYAAGESEPGERIHYEMRDEPPYEGTSFYRLQTTDLDGAISLSHLVEVNYANADTWDFQLFPNPNTGKQLNLRPAGLEMGTSLNLEILDVQGRALLRDTLTTDGTDHRFDLTTPLASGSYLIRVTDNKGQGKAKILIVR